MKMNVKLDAQNKKNLMIAGIIVGAAALLTYPAILLYRRLKNRRSQDIEENYEILQSEFSSNSRPAQRKVTANGQLEARL